MDQSIQIISSLNANQRIFNTPDATDRAYSMKEEENAHITSMQVPSSEHSAIYVERQVRIPPFAMSYEHYHSYCEIFYLRSGTCTYNVNGCAYPLEAGDLFIVSPGDSHSTVYRGSAPCERIIIYCMLSSLPSYFEQSFPEMASKLHQSRKIVFQREVYPKVDTLMQRLEEESASNDHYSDLFLTTLFTELCLTIQRHGIMSYEPAQEQKSYSSDISSAIQYINMNFAMPITLESTAASINLSPTYLSRKFRKEVGITFKEYLNSVRMRQAAQMLVITDNSITAIATACGFNSSNYFKDSFKRTNGMSPREYRKHNHITTKQ
ncbi:MAG: AraC family transcriptional regulator [Lachnospiraceae bacterium]|nr:AraC family transcriptional regulator [Lachnospiraceae bacterium]